MRITPHLPSDKIHSIAVLAKSYAIGKRVIMNVTIATIINNFKMFCIIIY